MSAAEKETLFKCVVRDHSALHKFITGHTSEAFEAQEMGAAGTGSLEHGDASGDIFWIAYPFPVTSPTQCLPRVHTVLYFCTPSVRSTVPQDVLRLATV